MSKKTFLLIIVVISFLTIGSNSFVLASPTSLKSDLSNTGVNDKSVADAGNPLVDCDTVNDCTWIEFLRTLNKVKNYGFQIVVVMSVIFIVYAGSLYLFSAGNSGKIEQAKTIISNVVIGFFLAAAGWLIVSAVLNTLGVENQNLAPAELLKK